jgi:hypothetical protein
VSVGEQFQIDLIDLGREVVGQTDSRGELDDGAFVPLAVEMPQPAREAGSDLLGRAAE